MDPAWKLEDAKARFSEVVRRARGGAPQWVTVHGQEAVVVLSVADFERLTAVRRHPTLHSLLSEGPLSDLDLDIPGVRSPVRHVEL